MESARAIHQAARHALEARFFTDWRERAPYSEFDAGFLDAVAKHTIWPSPEQYDELARQASLPSSVQRVELPRFVMQDRDALRRLGGYEQHVARARAVPTRARSWHDFFNMAVWAHFPRLRWALNAIHVDDSLGPIDVRNRRAPQQNVAAQFDESGIIVASSAPDLLEELRSLRFKSVFWARRAELQATTTFLVVGHGMLESMLSPHRGLSGKALLLELPRPPAAYEGAALRHELDARVAELIAGWRADTPTLDPLPLLGIPGYADNTTSEFYDDDRYFRFQRRPR